MNKSKPVVIALTSALVLPIAGLGATAAQAEDNISPKSEASEVTTNFIGESLETNTLDEIALNETLTEDSILDENLEEEVFFSLNSINAYVNEERRLIIDWSDYTLNDTELDSYRIRIVGGGYNYGRFVNVLDEPDEIIDTIAVNGNTNYKITFTLIDSNGDSSIVTSEIDVPYFNPSPVQDLTFDSVDGVVTWVTPIDNGGSEDLTYDVKVSYSDERAEILYSTDKVESFAIPDYVAIPGSSITIAITASNPDSTSVAAIIVHDEPAVAPTAPQNVTFIANDTDLIAQWSAPINDGGAAVNTYAYELVNERGEIVQSSLLSGVAAQKNFRLDLIGEPGETYTFKVQAVNAVAGSHWVDSVSVQVRPQATPGLLSESQVHEQVKNVGKFNTVYDEVAKTITITANDVQDDWLYAVIDDGTVLGWDDRADYNARGEAVADDVFTYKVTGELTPGTKNVILYTTDGVEGHGTFVVEADEVTPPVIDNPTPPNSSIVDKITNVIKTIMDNLNNLLKKLFGFFR